MNRRVRIGPNDYLLVARRDVLDLRDRAGARAFVEGGSLSADATGSSHAMLIDALAGGALVPVRLERTPRLMDAPSARPLVEPGQPRPLPPGLGMNRRIELQVLHETGGVFAGARLWAELPDGRQIDGVLDEHSRWIYPGVTGSGPCTVWFYEPLRLTEAEHRRPSSDPCTPGPDDPIARIGTAPQLSVRADRAHRLVVRLPPPVPVVGLDAGVFVPGQAFVTPGVARALDEVADALREEPSQRVTVFAHADHDADPQADKRLSDRRAKALEAVLLDDERAFDALAEDDGWSLRHDQAMLRGLGCNPAAIDGIDGPMTRRAVRWFQDEWSRGVHHPDGLAAPLPVTGTLDASTRHAVRRAYLLDLSPQLSPQQLAGPGAVGCAGFTLPPSSTAGRRGSLALWPDRRRVPVDMPCQVGDPAACRLDDRDENDRCRFHRETFQPADPSAAPCFYDFDWLRLPSGAFNLSAITSLPDGTHVRLWVMRDVQDYDGRVRHHHGPAPLPRRGMVVGEPIDGIVRYGVCVALWHAPADWDPLRWRGWWSDLDPEDGRDPDSGALFHPPLFAIEYDGGWAFSRPPGERIDRFFVRHARRPGLALANDGRFVMFSTTDGDRIVCARERRADEHLQILGWCTYGDFLTEQEGAS